METVALVLFSIIIVCSVLSFPCVSVLVGGIRGLQVLFPAFGKLFNASSFLSIVAMLGIFLLLFAGIYCDWHLQEWLRKKIGFKGFLYWYSKTVLPYPLDIQ